MSSSNRDNASTKWEMPTIGDVADVVTMQASITQLKETIKEEAYQQGYAEGKKQGYDDGLKQASEEILLKKNELQKILETLSQPLYLVNAEVESVLLSLCRIICEHILSRELRSDPNSYLNMVEQILRSLSQEISQFTIEMSQEDYTSLSHHCDADMLNKYTIAVDQNVQTGHCRIMNKSLVIDAGFKTRLDEIFSSLNNEDE